MKLGNLYLRHAAHEDRIAELVGDVVGLVIFVVCIIGALHLPAFVVWLAENVK